MTTITLPRALVEQALEVINDTAYGAPVFRQEVRDTITTLRAALAQPDPQDPELSAALGWPGGISDPVLDRTLLLQMVAALRLASQQALEFFDAEFGWSPGEAPRIDALRSALAQQAEPVAADALTEPKSGDKWRVEWWNESCRMMLPAHAKLDSFVAYKNGTIQFTIKRTAA